MYRRTNCRKDIIVHYESISKRASPSDNIVFKLRRLRLLGLQEAVRGSSSTDNIKPKEIAILMNHFQDEKINQTLSLFLKDIQYILSDKLLSVYIYGSALHNDLCPGYGDLDYLVIVNNNLTSNEIDRLNRLRGTYRSEYDLFTSMLEGAFLPLQLIQGEEGQALWWGTKGENIWSNNQLDLFTMYTIKNQGMLLYGESQNHIMPEISNDEIRQFLIDFSICMRKHGKGGSLHSIDWLLLTAKFIGWLKEGIIFSKSQAADWGLKNIKSNWKEHLHKAKELRKDPSKVKFSEYIEWINSLDVVIIEASNDLDMYLNEGANIL